MIFARYLRRLRGKRVRHADNMLLFAKVQNARLAPFAVATFTDSTNPSDTQTVTIGSKVYTFQTTLTEADGHVKIGATAALSLTNLFHAINKSGGTAGTDYANAMVANADFVATNPTASTVVITAKVKGTRTDATTSTCTGGTWGATKVVNPAAFDTFKSLRKNTAAQIAAASTAGGLKS